MEKENSNYIYIPLLGVFISILALLILAEGGDGSKILPYGFIGLISVVDLFREISKENDDNAFFNGYDGRTNDKYYQNEYKYGRNEYCYRNTRNNLTNKENELPKIRQLLKKTNLVKLHKEEKN